jgi:cation diffusion facilitator CzcD-associated flavoprotein CzcO
VTETLATPTLIIGAGPAGLAVAGRMRRLGFPFEMVDAGDAIASSWRGHYDRLHLHTVKGLSHLPYEPFPDGDPRYIPRDRLIEYYEWYARKYLIEPTLGVAVLEVARAGDRWRVETDADTAYLATTVVVATGANRVPNRPGFEGEESFEGEIVHSRFYKNPEPFLGMRLLIVGMGNTGAEIALDLAEHGVTVALSVRSPVNIVPRDSLGIPTQLTARALDVLPTRAADAVGRAFRRLSFGDLEPWGIKTPRMAPMAQLRTLGKTPVIDVGTIARIKRGDIAVRPGVRSLLPAGVRFTDGSEEPFDVIILATGYRPVIQDIVEDGAALLDANGFPTSVVAGGRFDGLYFTGFDNYQAGGVLGTLLDESEEIVEDIAERRRSEAL